MHNPTHPGKLLREMFIEKGLSVTAAAKKLEVPTRTLSDVVNGRLRITTKLAVALAREFNTTAESWLTQQMQYDLWEIENKTEVKPSKPSLMQPME